MNIICKSLSVKNNIQNVNNTIVENKHFSNQLYNFELFNNKIICFMNFTRNFLFVLCFAIIIAVLPSCENISNDTSVDEDAVVTVTFKCRVYTHIYNGVASEFLCKEIPVYLFAGDIQTFMRDEYFWTESYDAYDNIIYNRENAIASAVTDTVGKAVFVIDKKYLYGSVKRAFAVGIFDDDGELLDHSYLRREGISSGENVELETYFFEISLDEEIEAQKPISLDLSNVSTEIKKGDNLSGTIIVTYNDGTTKEIPIDNATTSFDNSSIGEQDVTVTYEGVSARIKVRVWTINGNGHCLVVKTQDMASQTWDSRFWFYSPTKFVAGASWSVSMKVRADVTTEGMQKNGDGTDLDLDANGGIGTHTYKDNPGNWIHWAGVGNVKFTTEWETYTAEGTFAYAQEDGDYIAFNLNDFNAANNYYFDDISFKIGGVEQIKNGDFEGDDFSSFWIKEYDEYHGYHDPVKVTKANIIELKH